MSARLVASSLALFLLFAAGTVQAQDPVKVAPDHFTVLLENAPAGAPDGASTGVAHILRYQNTDIAIEADGPGGGFVVLNDVWHPWWRASVDDNPVDILKANVLFRAVVVPPGKHVVRFTFHPFSGAFAELRAMLSAVKP